MRERELQPTFSYKQLWECQNGHPRWLYMWLITNTVETKLVEEWGERTCECPTGDFGEGYAPAGDIIEEKLSQLLNKGE